MNKLRKSENAKRRYLELKSKGKCILCMRESLPKHIHCESCRLVQRAANDKYNNKLRAKGLCINCRAPSPALTCKACKRKHYIAHKKVATLENRFFSS